ncbi:phage-related tail protein [Novosphingobium sp. SG720]|nr:phage-related tail protein [Novosphingobium sp. SG720]
MVSEETKQTPDLALATPAEAEQPVQDNAGANTTDRLAQARAKAADVGSTVRQVVEQHPLAALAGGIALGLVVGKLAGRSRKAPPSRNFADFAGPAEQAAAGLSKKAGALATLAAEVAMAYAAKAAEAGRDSVHKLEDIGSDAGGKLADGAGEARKKAGDLADVAGHVVREAADAALAKASELAARFKR